MRTLIDTCVIVDALQSRKPFNVEAEEIILLASNHCFEGHITAKALTDIFYLMHRITHDNEATRKVIAKLYTLLDILDTTAIDCRLAIASPISDYEDAVMVETAKRSGLDSIVTRNTKDYTQSNIPVYTPKEFLDAIHEEMTDDLPNT